jgi:hypothetical protein
MPLIQRQNNLVWCIRLWEVFLGYSTTQPMGRLQALLAYLSLERVFWPVLNLQSKAGDYPSVAPYSAPLQEGVSCLKRKSYTSLEEML